ncbi:MAG: hypothetical protein ACRCYB_02510 [Aeromonas veronii]
MSGAFDPIWSQPGYLLMRKADPDFMRIPAKLNSHSGQREHPDP